MAVSDFKKKIYEFNFFFWITIQISDWLLHSDMGIPFGCPCLYQYAFQRV